MLFKNVSIAGLAHIDAPHTLTSDEINARLQPTLDRLGIKTDVLNDIAGVHSRRLWDADVQASDAATLAARKALLDAGIGADKIGLVVNTSVSRDYLEPSTASIVCGNLGVGDECQTFDVANACLAFINGMDIASRMIERGDIEYALIVNGESSNEITDRTIGRLLRPDSTAEQFRNEFASLTLGSGAAAMVMGRSELLPNGHRYKGSVTRAATLCLQAGAQGITVHPRPDERHIRAHDVYELAELMKAWPDREFNIEGNPSQNLMEFIRELAGQGMRPHQATFVPDSEDQFTSDHGWSFPQDAERLAPLIAECKALGVRVSLFMDPVPEQMAAAKAVGADRVELYTEPYAAAWGTAQQAEQLARYAEAAQAALDAGLGVNAGHDLNRDNLAAFVREVPGVLEVSIGHALIADALELGYAATVQAYQACIDAGFAAEKTPDLIASSAYLSSARGIFHSKP